MSDDTVSTDWLRLPISTFDELDDLVEKGQGVTTVTMEELRNAHGAGKLGVHVRTAISEKLASRGLRHLPKELPIYQEQRARVYKAGTPVAKIIEAAVNDLGEQADQVLRDAAGGEAAEVVQKIREMVCS